MCPVLGRCGWLRDKFGFSWQVVPTMLGELQSDDPARGAAVGRALFGMNKLVIAELQRAFDEA